MAPHPMIVGKQKLSHEKEREREPWKIIKARRNNQGLTKILSFVNIFIPQKNWLQFLTGRRYDDVLFFVSVTLIV